MDCTLPLGHNVSICCKTICNTIESLTRTSVQITITSHEVATWNTNVCLFTFSLWTSFSLHFVKNIRNIWSRDGSVGIVNGLPDVRTTKDSISGKGERVCFSSSRPPDRVWERLILLLSRYQEFEPCYRPHAPIYHRSARVELCLYSAIRLCGVHGENIIKILKTKRNLLYIRNQPVPRSKHFVPWL